MKGLDWVHPSGTAISAVTRISDRADPVPDDIWREAARHYDEQALSALLVEIGAINVWNRLNVAIKQVAGAAWG